MSSMLRAAEARVPLIPGATRRSVQPGSREGVSFVACKIACSQQALPPQLPLSAAAVVRVAARTRPNQAESRPYLLAL
jgi:hypothetical protein